MSWLSEAFKDVVEHTPVVGKVIEEVYRPVITVVEEVERPAITVAEEVYRPVEKVATEAVRETKDIVAAEKQWLESDEFKYAATAAGVALAGPTVLGTLGTLSQLGFQLGSTSPAPADMPASALGATQEEMVTIPNVVLYIVLGGLALLMIKRLLK